ENVHGDNGLAARSLQADGVPVVDDLEILTRDEQPAALGRTFLPFALDRHGRGEPVAVIDAAREEAPTGPAVAAIYGPHVAYGMDDRRCERVWITPQLFLRGAWEQREQPHMRGPQHVHPARRSAR